MQIEGEPSSALERPHIDPNETAASQRVDMRLLWKKWANTHGDHTEDQKVEHKQSGEMKKEQMGLALIEKELHASLVSAKLEVSEHAECSAIDLVERYSNWASMDTQVQHCGILKQSWRPHLSD